jgi:hypothetical protein
VSGLAPPREWDAVATAECHADGNAYTFVVLEAERFHGEEGDAPGVMKCVATALGNEVATPYRATALRRHGDTWAVGAVAIEVADLPADVEGKELMLTVTDQGERELLVDGRSAVAGMTAVEQAARGRHDAYVLRAKRLQGSLWEVLIDPL